MIRINFAKKEKREFRLPDLSKIKEINFRELLTERGILAIPILGLLIIAGELFYLKQLKDEIMSLKEKVEQLTVERNKLKKQADFVQAQKRKLQAEIAQGRMEALLNYQTIISDLTGMELAYA
jgi:FtsZ-binding cell division protein ZapB